MISRRIFDLCLWLRDAFKEMLDSVAEKHTFEECKEILKNSCVDSLISGTCHFDEIIILDIHLDPGFKDFFQFCKANDIPVVIVSRHVMNLLLLNY